MAAIEVLFSECLAGKHREKSTITGGTVMRYSISPFLVWCEAFAPIEDKDPQSKYMHLLFERGIEHEKKVLADLFSDAVAVRVPSESGFRLVLEACFKGAKSIAGAPLFFLKDDVHGVVDVLVRDDSHNSVFGDFHYTIREIKSAKNIKREYVLQGAFYNYLIGLVQGYVPQKFTLINREEESFDYEYKRYEGDLLEVLKGIREVLSGKEVSPAAKLCKWPWESYCLKRAIEADDVSIVPNVGAQVKRKLNAVGVKSASDLAKFTGEVDIPPATFKKIQFSAKAWVEKKPVIISKPKLPKSNVEIFLDFEGTDELETPEGLMKVDYLVGLLVRENGEERFVPFVSESIDGEKKMMMDFFEFIRKYPKAPIYHYSSYESTHMRSLGQKYGVDVSGITKNMIDLLSVVKKCVAFPTISNSLKDIGKFLGYSWRGMADAQESIVLYLEFLDTKKRETLQRIVDYNEDDVRATAVVKDFMQKVSDEN
ncbi:TM0106 family RecB-like putative nuclease [Candidatus Woesearchaeota archaeon]|nr:TM0106 family RecB-like putative nuclease [Candidatus Woesearchaeota archaeon]